MIFFRFFLIIGIFALLLFGGLFFIWNALENQRNFTGEITNKNYIGNLKSLKNGNAIVTNIWIEEDKFKNFMSSDIKYLIVDIGEVYKDGTLASEDTELLQFLEKISKFEKSEGIDLKLLPYSEIITQDYNINSDRFQKNYISESKKLIGMGFDGAYIDFEGIDFKIRKDYILFLEKLREEIGNKALIFVVGGHYVNKNTDNSWEWDRKYYEEISKRADVVFIGLYDSGSKNEDEYRFFISKTLEGVAYSKMHSYVMFGLPAHKPYPEVLGIAADEYNRGVKEFEPKIIGTAVFAEWVMNKVDWEIFNNEIVRT